MGVFNVNYSYAVEFSTLKCAACGVSFAVTDEYQQHRREDHRTFYCPNGDTNWYPQKTKAEQLEIELEAERKKTAAATQKQWEAQATADKLLKEAARLQKRATAGVCSCCHRTFQNVARHMKTKHGGTK